MNAKPASRDRRTQPRCVGGVATTTGIVPLLIHHPAQAADALEQDLAGGADPQMLTALLDAAEAILALHGVDRSSHLAGLRKRLARQLA